MLRTRLKFMGRVDLEPFSEHKQSDQLPRLLNGAFPVLTGHHTPHLERRPLPIPPCPQRIEQERVLPVIQGQAGPAQDLPALLLKLRAKLPGVGGLASRRRWQPDAPRDGQRGRQRPPSPLMACPPVPKAPPAAEPHTAV